MFGKGILLAFFVALMGMLAAAQSYVPVVTMPTNAPTQILGEVEVKRGGPAVESKTNPSFKVAVPKVSPPATQTSSTS